MAAFVWSSTSGLVVSGIVCLVLCDVIIMAADSDVKETESDKGEIRVTRFGYKKSQIGPKRDKSGTFQIRFQYILARCAKMY